MASLLNNVQNFIQGYKNLYLHDTLPLHIQEQVQLRSYLCSPCLTNGKCLRCGCKTPAMFYAPEKRDEAGK